MVSKLDQLTLFAADTPASHSVQPGDEEARRMTVTSGLRCVGLSKNSGPLGSLERMLLGTSRWASTKCLLTWTHSATPQGRLLFRLVPSMPRTDETGSGLWPTPTARDWKDGSAESCANVEANGLLGRVVHLYATPQARDYRTGNQERWEDQERTRNLNDQIGGLLTPEFVEWLMGYETAWTELDPSEIASYRKSRKKLAGLS